jgi:hypothetical protein
MEAESCPRTGISEEKLVPWVGPVARTFSFRLSGQNIIRVSCVSEMRVLPSLLPEYAYQIS